MIVLKLWLWKVNGCIPVGKRRFRKSLLIILLKWVFYLVRANTNNNYQYCYQMSESE